MNIQEENSAVYFWVQSEREQTLVHYFLSASLNLLYYVPNNLYLTLIASFGVVIRTIHSTSVYVYKYSVAIYLLCMIKVWVRWCTCSL